MAPTIAVEKSSVPGARFRKDCLVSLDATYPNPAGYVFTPASFGLNRLASILFAGSATLAAGLYEPIMIPTYTTDGSNLITSFALHLIVGTTGVEVANAVDVHTTSLLLIVEGD